MPDGVLTPRRGYTLLLSQTVGHRPRVHVDCTACHFYDAGVPIDLEARTDEALGAVVREALARWDAHMCEAAYPSERAPA